MGISAVFVSLLPMEKILEDLQDTLTNYKLQPTEEHKKKFEHTLMMTMMKFDVMNKDPEEIIQKFANIERKRDMLDNLTGENLNQN